LHHSFPPSSPQQIEGTRAREPPPGLLARQFRKTPLFSYGTFSPVSPACSTPQLLPPPPRMLITTPFSFRPCEGALLHLRSHRDRRRLFFQNRSRTSGFSFFPFDPRSACYASTHVFVFPHASFFFALWGSLLLLRRGAFSLSSHKGEDRGLAGRTGELSPPSQSSSHRTLPSLR